MNYEVKRNSENSDVMGANIRGSLETRTHNHQEPKTTSIEGSASECPMIEDLKVINLSNFKLEKRYTDLLSRGLSFSPSTGMDLFDVFKDVCLFLRRVYFKLLYSDRSSEMNTQTSGVDSNDMEAIDLLVSLLEEGTISTDDEEIEESFNWRISAGLKIRSTSMPQFRKNKRLGVFLNLVQEDLEKVEWKNSTGDNLSVDERKALKELQKAQEIVIKQSDKGVNVVLLSTDMYEREVRRLLSDKQTYRKLDYNPFLTQVKLL